MNHRNTSTRHASVFLKLSALAFGITLLFAVGCYDPTTDKVDAGGGAAKKVEQMDVAENDIEFELDGDNCDIKWTGSNSAGLSPHGYFYDLTGQATIDGKFRSLKNLEITIDMNGVKAMNQSLTEKLKNNGFFEVETFPESKFVLTSINQEAREGDPEGTNAVIEGNFQLRDVTQSIKIPVEVAIEEISAKGINSLKLTLKSEFKINRKDYGVVYSNATEDALIRDDILLNIDIEVEAKTSER